MDENIPNLSGILSSKKKNCFFRNKSLFLTHFDQMETIKYYTLLERYGSPLSIGIGKTSFFDPTKRHVNSDIFLYTIAYRLTSEHAGTKSMRDVPTQTAPLKNLVRNGSKGSLLHVKEHRQSFPSKCGVDHNLSRSYCS